MSIAGRRRRGRCDRTRPAASYRRSPRPRGGGKPLAMVSIEVTICPVVACGFSVGLLRPAASVSVAQTTSSGGLPPCASLRRRAGGLTIFAPCRSSLALFDGLRWCGRLGLGHLGRDNADRRLARPRWTGHDHRSRITCCIRRTPAPGKGLAASTSTSRDDGGGDDGRSRGDQRDIGGERRQRLRCRKQRGRRPAGPFAGAAE